MKNSSSALLACVLVGFAQSSSAGLFDDEEARRRIDALQAETAERFQRLESTAQAQVLLNNDIQALRAELARLRGQIEVLSNELAQSQKRQQDFYVDLDGRLRKTEAGLTQLGEKVAVVPAKPAEPPAPDSAMEARDYDAAIAAMRGGKHVDAAVGFRNFISNYPNSANSASAHFWAGSAFAQAKDLATARDYLSKVPALWPNDPLAPEALLTLSGVQQEAGDTKSARTSLETLVAKYPNSDAAKTAKQRLGKR